MKGKHETKGFGSFNKKKLRSAIIVFSGLVLTAPVIIFFLRTYGSYVVELFLAILGYDIIPRTVVRLKRIVLPLGALFVACGSVGMRLGTWICDRFDIND